MSYPWLGYQLAHALAGGNPEWAQKLALNSINCLPDVSLVTHALKRRYERASVGVDLSCRLGTATLRNPVGLAAGVTKDGKGLHVFNAMGFGLVAVGTVLPDPQQGNSSPRLWTFPESGAVVNRLGFPSEGMMRVEKRVRTFNPCRFTDLMHVMLSLGKRLGTQLEEAHIDYRNVIEWIGPDVDSLEGNISSPNTKDLRVLQHGKYAHSIFDAVREGAMRHKIPGFIKVAPDLTWGELEALAHLAREYGLGLTLNNTTVHRPEEGYPDCDEMKKHGGGLSGRPLQGRSREILAFVAKLNLGIPLISVGGIDSADEALRRLDLGADAIQLYTGLVFQGPQLFYDIIRALARRKEHVLAARVAL